MGPLEGYRVIELAQGIPGAVAGMHLGDGSADVIKVETPVGVHRPPPALGQHTGEILDELASIDHPVTAQR